MAENSFHIPLTLFFVTLLLLMMFGHCKATPATTGGNVASSMEPPQPTKAPTRPENMKSCKKYLPEFEMRCDPSCACGSSEKPMQICYPAVMSEEGEPVQKIKPSRRFSILAANKPEKLDACPTEEGAVKYRDEFGRMSNAFLDDHHQLFLSMTAHGLDCGKMEVATTTAAETTNATTTALETTNSTTTTTPTTSTKKTTTTPATKPTTTTTAPTAVKHRLVPKSYELLKELQDGCKIKISAELPTKGTFVIRLLKDYPEPITGLAETMFQMEVTDKQIILETPRNKKKSKPLERRDWFDQEKFELEIRVHDNEHEKRYAVYVDGTFLRDLRNDDHPPWASNYIHIEGDLKPVGTNPIKMECDTLKGPLDCSDNLEGKKPTELELVDLQINDTGTVTVYLLKGCRKFDMTVCMFALEYKMTFVVKGENEDPNNNKIVVKCYSRQPPPKGTWRKIATILPTVTFFPNEKYKIKMSLDNSQEINLKLQDHEWQKHTLEWKENWEPYMHEHADFVQVVAEGGIHIGNRDRTLHMAQRPVPAFNGDNMFEAGKTEPPWHMEHKIKNWANGDYIRLRIRMKQNMKKAVQLNLYRGYQGWIDDPKTTNDFGQSMLHIIIKRKGKVVFKDDNCEWKELRNRTCKPGTNLMNEMDIAANEAEKPVQADKEYVVHIMAHKNKDNENHAYSNGLKLVVFDGSGKNRLATYAPVNGPPSYTIEYFQVQKGDFVLMEEPKFCKKDDEKC